MMRPFDQQVLELVIEETFGTSENELVRKMSGARTAGKMRRKRNQVQGAYTKAIRSALERLVDTGWVRLLKVDQSDLFMVNEDKDYDLLFNKWEDDNDQDRQDS